MLKIAWRNLWRHRTRTWITVAAVAFTYALYLLTSGIQEFTYTQMEQSAAKAAGGNVLVQAEGYQDSQMNDVLMTDGASVLQAVRQEDGVDHAAPRVIVSGLLSTSASSTAVRLMAVEPEVEQHFHDIDDYLTEGTFLEGDRRDPIVLGSKIVEDLELELGDRVILTATDPDGEMRRSLFHLSGILNSGSTITDRALAFTTVDMGRQALGVDGALTQIGILGPADRFELSERLAGKLGEGYEVLTWDEAMPDLVGLIEMDRRYGDVFAIILFLVVLIAIMNTFLMAVMERVRELGLMSAIGMTPGRVVLLVFLETLLLSLVAIAIGLVLGFTGHLLIDTYGLDMSSMYGSDMDMAGVALTDTVIYSEIDPGRWFSITTSVVFMVLLSAAYPAYKAAKLVPAEAMRFYE